MVWFEFVAGVSAGGAATLLLHPLDLLKIRFQVQDGMSTAMRYQGTADALVKIVRSDGVRGLYQGLTPNLIGSTTSWGLYFLFYGAIKQKMAGEQRKHLGPSQYLMSAAAAGLITSFLTNPIWVIKTRMCLQSPNQIGNYSGFTNAVSRIFQEEGIKGFYQGLVPSLFGISHGAIQFMAYEELKKFFQIEEKTEKLSPLTYVLIAGISKSIAAVATYPYQVVRSRLQIQKANQEKLYKGTIDCITKVARREGFQGFYKGLFPNLLRVLPATCVTFVVYESISGWFKDESVKKLKI